MLSSMESPESNYSTEIATDSQLSNNQRAKYTLQLDIQSLLELIPISFIIVVVNMLVIVLFWKTRRLQTTANYILLSLAAGDFVTGALNIPLFIIVFFTPVIPHSDARFYLGYLVTVLHSFTAVLTVFHILIATTEKYLSIIKPVVHRLVTRRTVKNVLVAVWFVSAAISFIPVAWINIARHHSPATYFTCYGIFCIVVIFLLPYSFMIYVFTAIVKAILQGVGRNGTSRQIDSHRKRTMHRERKCIILFASMATTFAVCWFPWYLITLLLVLEYHIENNIVKAFVLFRYATAISNPLLYTFFRPDFRAAFRSLISKNCGCVIGFQCMFSQKGSRNICIQYGDSLGEVKIPHLKPYYKEGVVTDTFNVESF